jgi:hypothetical protein
MQCQEASSTCNITANLDDIGVMCSAHLEHRKAPSHWCAILAVTLLIGLVLGWDAQSLAAGASDAPVNQPSTPSRHAIPDFADLVAQVKPAVVSITSRLQVSPERSDQEAERGQTLPFPFN